MKIKRGDIITLGRHKLACGSFEDKELIKKLFRDKKADCVLTDPPYGTLKHKIETKPNIDEFYKICNENTKEDCFISVFGMFPTALDWINKAVESGLEFKGDFVWNKRRGTSPAHPYQRVHENIFYFRKGKKMNVNRVYLEWHDGFVLTTTRDIDELSRILKTKDINRIKKWIEFNPKEDGKDKDVGVTVGGKLKEPKHRYIHTLDMGEKGMKTPSILNIPISKKDSVKIPHPTVKPLAIIKTLLKIFSNEDTIVFDPFLGSGTTLLVAEQNNRTCYGVEIDPEYCQLIVDRYREETRVGKFNI